MWWQRSAAGPVITLPLPAYSSRGHFLLERRRRPGRGQVDAGQQAAPRPAEPKPMPERAGRNADGQRLMARDHVDLLAQDPVERIRSGREVRAMNASCRRGPTNSSVCKSHPECHASPRSGAITAAMDHRCRCQRQRCDIVSLRRHDVTSWRCAGGGTVGWRERGREAGRGGDAGAGLAARGADGARGGGRGRARRRGWGAG